MLFLRVSKGRSCVREVCWCLWLTTLRPDHEIVCVGDCILMIVVRLFLVVYEWRGSCLMVSVGFDCVFVGRRLCWTCVDVVVRVRRVRGDNVKA